MTFPFVLIVKGCVRNSFYWFAEFGTRVKWCKLWWGTTLRVPCDGGDMEGDRRIGWRRGRVDWSVSPLQTDLSLSACPLFLTPSLQRPTPLDQHKWWSVGTSQGMGGWKDGILRCCLQIGYELLSTMRVMHNTQWYINWCYSLSGRSDDTEWDRRRNDIHLHWPLYRKYFISAVALMRHFLEAMMECNVWVWNNKNPPPMFSFTVIISFLQHFQRSSHLHGEPVCKLSVYSEVWMVFSKDVCALRNV